MSSLALIRVTGVKSLSYYSVVQGLGPFGAEGSPWLPPTVQTHACYCRLTGDFDWP